MGISTIKVLSTGVSVEGELKGNGTIKPGHLLEIYNNSGVETVKVHATSGGDVCGKMFALEDALQGNDITDAYSSGDNIKFWVPLPGEIVYARIANGETINYGNKLMSAGDGTLKEYSAQSTPTDSSSETILPNVMVGIARSNPGEIADSSGDDSSAVESPNYMCKVQII